MLRRAWKTFDSQELKKPILHHFSRARSGCNSHSIQYASYSISIVPYYAYSRCIEHDMYNTYCMVNLNVSPLQGHREQTVLLHTSLVNGVLPLNFPGDLTKPWGRWIRWYSTAKIGPTPVEYWTSSSWFGTQIGSKYISRRISGGAARVNRANRSFGGSGFFNWTWVSYQCPKLPGIIPNFCWKSSIFRSTKQEFELCFRCVDKDHRFGSPGSQGSIWCLFHHLTGWMLSDRLTISEGLGPRR